MIRLFPSKSSGVGRTTIDSLLQDEEEEQEEEDHYYFPINISPERRRLHPHDEHQQVQVGLHNIVAILAAALRKSLLVTCSVETEDFSSMDIGHPTDVRHVSHVTFDRFNGFLGLPAELQPQLPTKVPSARSLSSTPTAGTLCVSFIILGFPFDSNCQPVLINYILILFGFSFPKSS